MSKDKHYRDVSRENESFKKDLHGINDKYAVEDDIEALADEGKAGWEQPLDVQVLEDELVEDVVDAQDEGVLPEDNISKELEETKAALEKEKKEYLFLMADFDNFRKRVIKEKAELIKNASEKVLKGLLPIVDDFERGLEATKGVQNDSGIREGMELIYNKLIKYLSENGVKPMDTTDADFDAEIHEAIASIPTGDDTKKGKIIDTTQKGYMLNDKVLRHAKVVVGD